MMGTKLVLTLLLAGGLMTAPLPAFSAIPQDQQTQNQASALMRGYRTGYSDGYQAGVNDAANKANRDFRGKPDYAQGDRAYVAAHGARDEYRDGYQQGFESGYNAAYDGKAFDSTIPTDLKRRPATDSGPPVLNPVDSNTNTSTNTSTPDPNATTSDPSTPPVTILRDTIMRVELLSNLSTNDSKQGDTFQVRVIEPKEFDGAIMNGKVMRVQRPGKAKGTAELQLAFDQIKFTDGRIAPISAQVIEVIPGGGDGVGKVDPEGGVKGQDSTKSDIVKVGAAIGIGAVIGAITGGGSGAAIGGSIGAGVGTAGVLSQRGKDIRLYQGQQLRLRTAGDAEVK